MKLKNERLKKEGKMDAKVNELTEESLFNAFGVTKDHMLEAAKILEAEGNTKNSENPSDLLLNHYEPANYRKSVDQEDKDIFFINMGSTKGTTFKINDGGLVFSSLFDTEAQVSCMKYDTVDTLGLLGQSSDNNINGRTANGQDMGVVSSVMVDFKVGPCSFAHRFIVLL